MSYNISTTRKGFLLAIILFLTIGCSILSPAEKTEEDVASIQATSAAPAGSTTATPTPTPQPEISNPSNAAQSRCKGLSGEIEIWVVVGPAAAVGMEPFAVGSSPFSVTSQEPPYLIEGGGPIEYNEILVEKWGTYEVTFNMDTTILGECAGESDSEMLALELLADGEQNVIVDAGGFHGEYPWAGSHTFDLNFPIEDGARVEGEGYIFVLHINP